MKINKNLMDRNHTELKRSNGQISYIVVHYVGALGDAKANTDYYKSTDVGASADFWVGFAGDIWQGNDYRNYYSWHCGGGLQSSSGHRFFGKCKNANSVGVEMCVRKKSKKTMDATDKDWYFESATVESAAQLVAYLMKELDVDIDHVIRHYDVTGKICPNPFVYDTGAVTWAGFKEKVKAYTSESRQNDNTGAKTWYRVRISWDDEKSQIGAYELPENAKKNCPAGYSVYDESGNAVYTNGAASGTQVAAFADLSETESASRLLEIAKPIAESYGLFPSVLAAQSILESGYCKTELAKKANNILGMKSELLNKTWTSPVWSGESVTIATTEYYNGVKQVINDQFRKYSCIEDCMKDRCAFFTQAKVSVTASQIKYHGITECQNYKTQIQLIKDRGYATDPEYVSKVCKIIEKYSLARYDAIQTEKTDQSGGKQYTVQAGSFVNKSYANNLLKKIKAAGLPAILKQTGGKFVVQCGVFSEKKNAEALVQKIKNKGFDAIIK